MMNNEPVAWMVQYKDRHKFVSEEPLYSEHILACEPLYTHSAEHDLGIAEAIGFEKGYQAGLKKAQE